MNLEHFDTVMSFVVVMLLLSMLITVLVQFAVAVSGLRGLNLLRGVTGLIGQIDPSLKTHAAAIADAVLQHATLAHLSLGRGRRKATAIRPDELLRVLGELARAGSQLPDAPRQALVAALGAAGAPDPPAWAARATVVVTELTQLFPQQAQAVQAAVDRGMVRKNQFETQLSTWFDTVMDRTSERFVLHTRWITAAFAFLLAIGLQVDAVDIYRQLSVSGEVRARLVAGADATLAQAGAVAADTDAPKALATAAIRAMVAGNDVADERATSALSRVPGDLVTRKAGRDFLATTVTSDALPAAIKAFDNRFELATVDHLKELGTSFSEVKASLDGAGLDLLAGAARPRDWRLGIVPMPTLGELMTGLFLSLGAPFWFNALGQLSNLRPAIAGKVDKDAAAA